MFQQLMIYCCTLATGLYLLNFLTYLVYGNIDVALSKMQMMMCWKKVCKPQVGIRIRASLLEVK